MTHHHLTPPHNQIDHPEYYPADISATYEENAQKVWIGFKVDPETQHILDCKWMLHDMDTLSTALSTYSQHIIGQSIHQIEFLKKIEGESEVLSKLDIDIKNNMKKEYEKNNIDIK